MTLLYDGLLRFSSSYHYYAIAIIFIFRLLSLIIITLISLISSRHWHFPWWPWLLAFHHAIVICHYILIIITSLFITTYWFHFNNIFLHFFIYFLSPFYALCHYITPFLLPLPLTLPLFIRGYFHWHWYFFHINMPFHAWLFIYGLSLIIALSFLHSLFFIICRWCAHYHCQYYAITLH